MDLNETRKRMQQLYEYSFYNGVMEDDTQVDDPNAMGGGPNAMGGNPGGGNNPMMGGDPNAMGGNPGGGNNPMMGGDPNAMGGNPGGGNNPNAMGGNPGGGNNPMMGGDPNAMGGDPNAMGDDPSAMGGDIDGANLAPNAGMNGGDQMGDPMMGGDPNAMDGQPGPDDDVVDITALTDAQDELKSRQEETAEQLQDVDSKLSTLLNVVDKFTKALDANDQKITDLKSELIKRTPTEEETMNVRLNAGGNPFDQKPEEFWDKFEDINNHYNITSNNEAPQYQIRKGDIDSVNDRMVNNEFDDIDDMPRTLHDYFVK